MSREFIKEVNANLKSICKELGYKKSKDDFVLKINENVYHTIWFNTTSHRGVVSVAPFVGVCYKDILDLTGFLFNNKKKDIYPIAGHLLGYLMPESGYKDWVFSEGSDNESSYKEILFNIKKYGVPFQKRMETYENLFDAVSNNLCHTHRYYYLPVMYYLEGKGELGLKTIEEIIAEELKPHILTDYEYEAEIRTAKELKLPTENISRIRKGSVDQSYLDFLERYKMLCNNDIVWENK